jgi:hypothetical protein
MKERIIGPFFFVEATVMGGVYLDMFEQFVYPHAAEHHLPTGWGSATLEFVCSRTPRQPHP